MTVFLMTSGCVRQLHDQTMGDFICTFWLIFSLPLQQ